MQAFHRIRIALAQTAIVWEEKEQNIKKAEEQIKDAVNHRSEAIFFPEMSFTGFSMNTDATKERRDETVRRVQSLARQYRIAVGFGWGRDCGETCENHYTIADCGGRIVSDYTKIHPFSFAGEDLRFRGGSALSYFSLNGIICSTFVCYDLRFPEIFQAASKTAHAIIVPANWPAKRSAHWQTLLRARAIENQVYILAVNCTGDIGGIRCTGGSCVIDPEGTVRSVLHNGEGILYAELTDDAEDIRRGFPVRHDRREELYKSLE